MSREAYHGRRTKDLVRGFGAECGAGHRAAPGSSIRHLQRRRRAFGPRTVAQGCVGCSRRPAINQTWDATIIPPKSEIILVRDPIFNRERDLRLTWASA